MMYIQMMGNTDCTAQLNELICVFVFACAKCWFSDVDYIFMFVICFTVSGDDPHCSERQGLQTRLLNAVKQVGAHTNEPPCGETNNIVSEQVPHKSGCTVTEG